MTTPTAREIAAMPDRGLDILLAELITGQSRFTCRIDPMNRNGEPQFHFGYPHGHDFAPYYSTDHAAVAEAIAFVLSQSDVMEMEIHWWKDIGYSVLFVLWDGDNIETEELPRYGRNESVYPQTEPRAKAEAAALAMLAMREIEKPVA